MIVRSTSFTVRGALADHALDRAVHSSTAVRPPRNARPRRGISMARRKLRAMLAARSRASASRPQEKGKMPPWSNAGSPTAPAPISAAPSRGTCSRTLGPRQLEQDVELVVADDLEVAGALSRPRRDRRIVGGPGADPPEPRLRAVEPDPQDRRALVPAGLPVERGWS